MGNARPALERFATRETIEGHPNFLDAKDRDGIASCVSSDARSRRDFEREVLLEGKGIADWVRARRQVWRHGYAGY